MTASAQPAGGGGMPPGAQDCLECGAAARGICDPLYRFIQLVCHQCGSTWTIPLTSEQRQTLAPAR